MWLQFLYHALQPVKVPLFCMNYVFMGHSHSYVPLLCAVADLDAAPLSHSLQLRKWL